MATTKHQATKTTTKNSTKHLTKQPTKHISKKSKVLTTKQHKGIAKPKRGFTIIEVALVLAVAALIFLVVFLAVPALQRNQRDDARRRDVATVVQAVESMMAATGKVITSGLAYSIDITKQLDSNLAGYLDGLSGQTEYVIVYNSAVWDMWHETFSGNFPVNREPLPSPGPSKWDPYINVVSVTLYSSCRPDNTGLSAVATKTSFAVAVQLENGGNGKYYCQSSS